MSPRGEWWRGTRAHLRALGYRKGSGLRPINLGRNALKRELRRSYRIDRAVYVSFCSPLRAPKLKVIPSYVFE